jgi:hypothetical protein
LTIENSNLTDYISGEYGLMMALVMAVTGYLFWRKRGSLPQAHVQTQPESTLEVQPRVEIAG